MDVTEQAGEQSAEAEVLAGGPAPPPPIDRTWLRLAYVGEFWIALIAIFVIWSQVGGQAHLDLMAWYIKLICGVVLAFCAVRLTSAIVEKPRARNTTVLAWLLAILVLVTVMSYITYWYHLHEQDDQQPDENSATTVNNRIAGHEFRENR